MRTDNYQFVRELAELGLRRRRERGDSLTVELIKHEVRRAIDYEQATDVDFEALVTDLECHFQTWLGIARSLKSNDDGWKPWFPERRGAIRFDFWERYERYLRQKGWTDGSLQTLERTTGTVVGFLGDPQSNEEWDRRGMVVGQVQSGKTSNYIGVICKAADAGYKVIVVLAGFHKSLRSQTQVRLEEGFLGYDRSGMDLNNGPLVPVGVGLINPAAPRADTTTTRTDQGDFRRRVAQNLGIAPGDRPLLFVVKKNGNVLRNLISWIQSVASRRDEDGNPYFPHVPLLVIDDEADQGSIDTRRGSISDTGDVDRTHDPTPINQRIRQLLRLFGKSSYVGYTATPFANVLIHNEAETDSLGEDLFPRNFIVSLPASPDHIGPERVFGFEDEDGHFVEGLPTIRHVIDHADTLDLAERAGWMPPRHDSGHIPLYNGADTIPPSLRNALYSFILACAARRARGDESEHCSMLIHVTRLTAVQQRVRDQVEREMTEIRRRIRYEEPDQPTGIRADLRSIWDADFVPATAAISASDCPAMSWEEINEQLKLAANSIEVKEINGRAGEALDYIDHKSTGLKVIAIGGDKLSRGLTLEGLTCTYFLRASRMYDTLMQMGRWFGYRPRYLDLCRLYTTPDLVDWFGHITDAAQELRQEFEIMANAGASPKDFGLRVRSHPVMMVTSQVKMRHGDTVDVTFNGDICETVNFWRDSKHLGENWSAAVRLIESLENRGVEANCVRGGPQVGAWKWEGGHAQEISAFLDEYQEHNASVRVRTAPLADYVRSEIANGRLVDWTVFVASGDRPERGRLGNTAEFKLVRRSWHLLPRDNEIEKLRHQENNHFRIRRLVDPRDEYVDLSDEQVQVALQQTNRERAESQKAPTTRPSGPNIRRVRDQRKGLLMLYPLDPRDGALEVWDTGRTEPDAVDTPILGFAISFPDVDGGASQVTYVVNNVYSQIDRDYDDEAAGLNDSE